MPYKMNDHQFNKAQSLNCAERFTYCLDRVADWGELWILVNDDEHFLKLLSEEDQQEYLPIWPHPKLAEHYAIDAETSLTAKKISLETFFGRWIHGLAEDGYSISVFPGAADAAWIMEAEDFQEELELVLSKG
jgi:Protein of unknown function (DUF2750)